MLLETGVDVVEIWRIAQSLHRFGDRFCQRVYQPSELEDSGGRPASLAARFAAKEAVIKALGSQNLGLREIEVVRPPGQRPTIRLHGRAAERARMMGVRHVAVSLSHSRDYAVAVALLQMDSPHSGVD